MCLCLVDAKYSIKTLRRGTKRDNCCLSQGIVCCHLRSALYIEGLHPIDGLFRFPCGRLVWTFAVIILPSESNGLVGSSPAQQSLCLCHEFMATTSKTLDAARIVSLPNDAFYIPNFITEDEEQHLLRKVRNLNLRLIPPSPLGRNNLEDGCTATLDRCPAHCAFDKLSESYRLIHSIHRYTARTSSCSSRIFLS